MPTIRWVCIIPGKPYLHAKTRLAGILTPRERVAISRYLLLRTIRLARPLVDQVLVISRDTGLLSDAQDAGAATLAEHSIGLNSALTQAAVFARTGGAAGVLVLPADLPLLTAVDITSLLDQGRTPQAVVLAPCQRGMGTNGLLVAPPGLITFSFGEGSFARHATAANQIGIEPHIYHSSTIAFDLDTPADWDLIRDRMPPFDGNQLPATIANTGAA